jgi:hypothetical protein
MDPHERLRRPAPMSYAQAALHATYVGELCPRVGEERPMGCGPAWSRFAMLTLRTYAHAIREEEADLSFAEFEVRDGSKRLYAAPPGEGESTNENAPDLTSRGRFGNLEHETGLEPATPTLAKRRIRQK